MQEVRSAFSPVPQYTLSQYGMYQQPVYYPVMHPTYVHQLPTVKRVKVIVTKQRPLSSDEPTLSDYSTGDESVKETKIQRALKKNK